MPKKKKATPEELRIAELERVLAVIADHRPAPNQDLTLSWRIAITVVPDPHPAHTDGFRRGTIGINNLQRAPI